MRCFAAWVLIFVNPLTPAVASSIETPPLSYTQRLWRMQDGLPEQVVQAFAQTPDRYLWIATTGGLVRFDGERFQTFNRENTRAFTENNVFCLLVARDHTLWIGMEGGGLIRYRSGVFQQFSVREGLTNGFVRSIREDSHGRFWVGTDGGLFRLENERLRRVDDNGQIPGLAVHAIYEDSDGQIWVGALGCCESAATLRRNMYFGARPVRTVLSPLPRPGMEVSGSGPSPDFKEWLPVKAHSEQYPM